RDPSGVPPRPLGAVLRDLDTLGDERGRTRVVAEQEVLDLETAGRSSPRGPDVLIHAARVGERQHAGRGELTEVARQIVVEDAAQRRFEAGAAPLVAGGGAPFAERD